MRSARTFLLWAVALLWFLLTGALYAFPMWLEEMSYSLQERNALASSLYVSQLFGVLWALLRVHHSVLLGFCVLTQFIGYLLLWLTFDMVLFAWGVIAHLFIGLSAGGLFVVLVSLMLRDMKSNALFLGSLFTLAFGVGASAASFSLLYVPVPTFFLFMWIGALGIGAVSTMLLSFHEPAVSGEKAMLNVQRHEKEESTAQLLKCFFLAPESWLVMAIVFVKIGVGSAFTSNLVSLMQGTAVGFIPKRFVYPIFSVGQTVGRLLVTIVSPKKDWTLQLLLGISLLYVCVTSLLAIPIIASNVVASRVLPLVFSVGYGAMWTTTSSICSFSSVPQRQHWAIVASVVFPVGGAGPYLVNYVVGALHGLCSCFSFAMAFLAALSFLIFLLTGVLLCVWRRRSSRVSESVL